MIGRHLAGVVSAAVLLAAAGAAAAQGGGMATYKSKCQMCHGANGAGDTPAGRAMHILPFNDASVARLSTVALAAIVKNGQGKMPPYSDKLTDAQIKDVVTYAMGISRR